MESLLDQPQEAPSIESRFEALIKAENAPPREETGQFKKREQEPSLDAPPQEEAPAEQPAETPAEETPAEEADDEAPPVYKVKVDGEEIEVPLDEALKGYMRQADYTKKTQEVSRMREQAQLEARKAVESERTQFVQALQTLQEAVSATLAPELRGVDWNTLAANDPAEYVRKVARANELNTTLQAIQAAQKEAQEKAAEEQRANLQKQIQEATETLKRDLPKWDAETYQSLMKTGMETYGFTQQEIGSIIDPRMIKVLHDAQAFHALKNSKPVVQQKLEAPKVVKPGAKQKAATAADQEKGLRERLRQSGKTEDLASIFLSRLQRKQ